MPTKLTDSAVKNLKAKAKPYIIWDAVATGLGIRVTPANRRIWVMQAIWPGKGSQSRLTLGHFGTDHGMSLAEARSKAAEWHALVRKGKDPKRVEARRLEAERQAEAAAELAAELEAGNTFRAIAEDYLANRENRRLDLDRREIERTLIPEWGDLPIADITTGMVRDFMTPLAKRTPYEAHNAWGHASGIFGWAIHTGKLAATPMDRHKLKKALVFQGKVKARSRSLNDDEVFALSHAAVMLDDPFPWGIVYRWLLLTGCRLSEATGAIWNEFHPELRRTIRKADGARIDWANVPSEYKLWTLPPERFKSDRIHIVPLTDRLCGLLAKVPMRGQGEYVFSHTARETEDDPVGLWASSAVKRDVDERMLAKLQELARGRGDDDSDVTLPNWVNHDLRRTVRTNLSQLGISEKVAELVLGHVEPDALQKTYNQYAYLPERREALAKWDARVAKIIFDRE